MSEYEQNPLFQDEETAETVETTESVAEEKKPAKKSKKKKALIIGASVVGIIAAVVAVVLIVLANTPIGLLTTGIRNSMKALESSEISTMMEKVSNGGSMKVFLDLEKLLQGQNIPLSGTGYMKFYMNEKQQKAVISIGAETSIIQDISANIYTDKDSLVISSDWLLGDKAFGLEMDNLADDFNNSVFGPNGTYSLGVTIPDNFQDQLELYESFYKDLEELGKELGDLLLKSLEKNANLEKQNDELSLGGKDVKTTAVIMKMDHDQLANVLEDVLDYMRKNKAFEKFIEKYAELLLGDAYYWMDSEEAVEMFFEALDAAKDEMDELRDQMEEQEIALEVVCHISKSGKQLIGLEVIMESDAETIEFTIAAGPDLKKIDGIYFSMENGEQTVEGFYEINTNDKNEYEADLRIRANGESVLNGQVDWDKKEGDLAITATAEGSTVAIRGTLEQTGKKILLTLDSVEADGMQVEMGLGIELLASDKMPATPEYTNILKMTEDEVAAIISDLSTIFLQMAFGMA